MWLLYKDGSAGLKVTPILSKYFLSYLNECATNTGALPCLTGKYTPYHCMLSALLGKQRLFAGLHSLMCKTLIYCAKQIFGWNFCEALCNAHLPDVSLSSLCLCGFGVPFEGRGEKHSVSFHFLPGYVCVMLLLRTRNPHPF